MAIIKPFKALRPPKDIADKVASLPYDVMNASEARAMAEGNQYSLLHITRAEIDLPADTDVHSDEVYRRSLENFINWQEKNWLVQDEEPKFYIYAQTMEGRTQYGLVACAAVDDYLNGVIRKHELTRPEKEEDRMVHIRTNNANIEPVFFTYPAVKELDDIVNNIVAKQDPEYDFVADDGIGHHFWVIHDRELIARIEEAFREKVPNTYVADGHHRTAAAALVGKEKRDNNPGYSGNEEFNYFMAVHFPDNQLSIIDYNRLVKDLNGNSANEFIDKLEQSFIITRYGSDIFKPDNLHTFSMYLEGEWYKLETKSSEYDDTDPIGVLDVTIFTRKVLEPILDIQDLRRSKRIDFVGGIRGLSELKKRVDSGEMKAAFALYPVSMKQLIDIADTGNIMPPKTTWFEPKLRSGLAIHLLD